MPWTNSRLDELIAEATVDAYNDSEQRTGFYTMIADNLATPFITTLLGMTITVEDIDQANDESIIAICARGTHRQAINALDLPLPNPAPDGAEWLAAYRRWARH